LFNLVSSLGCAEENMTFAGHNGFFVSYFAYIRILNQIRINNFLRFVLDKGDSILYLKLKKLNQIRINNFLRFIFSA